MDHCTVDQLGRASHATGTYRGDALPLRQNLPQDPDDNAAWLFDHVA